MSAPLGQFQWHPKLRRFVYTMTAAQAAADTPEKRDVVRRLLRAMDRIAKRTA